MEKLEVAIDFSPALLHSYASRFSSLLRLQTCIRCTPPLLLCSHTCTMPSFPQMYCSLLLPCPSCICVAVQHTHPSPICAWLVLPSQGLSTLLWHPGIPYLGTPFASHSMTCTFGCHDHPGVALYILSDSNPNPNCC